MGSVRIHPQEQTLLNMCFLLCCLVGLFNFLIQTKILESVKPNDIEVCVSVLKSIRNKNVLATDHTKDDFL